MIVAQAREFLERREARRREADRGRWQRATADCAAVVGRIVEVYAPRRIWQWGSLLRPDRFGEGSDIDLAVEGVTDPEAFFALLGDAQALTSFPVDIVQLEKIESEFADLIRCHGTVVYERGS